MRRLAFALLLITSIAVAIGCGGGSGTEQTASSPPAATPPPAAAPAARDTIQLLAVSKYDDGPRAGASPFNPALAANGEKLFRTKGCVVCHSFGKKVTCPDLLGVTTRRTARWMEEQILHPEVMAKEDPISHGLKAQYPLPMTDQGLTPEEAKAVIEFLKRKDREPAAKAPPS
ncbi:MAG: c-type cytochrome [Candidatus Eiseniibacteriota bacterium]